MAFTDAFLPEFDNEMKTTRALLERVPLDNGEWKPHTKSTSLGGLASHLAGLAGYGAMIAQEDGLDISSRGAQPKDYSDRNELLAAFDENVRRSRDAIAAVRDDQLGNTWTLRAGDRTIFAMPRAAVFRVMLMNHMIHHRGQLSVYLRLNEIPLPPIYGPTADT